MKLCFTGPVLDFSGFAHAARNMLKSLQNTGADIVVRPLKYDQADMGSEYEPEEWLQEMMDAPLEGIDMLLQCTTANIEACPKPGLCNGLYTFFEYDRLPQHWINQINQFNFIIVPCVYNAHVLTHCGCRIPILVMPTAVDISLYKKQRDPLPIENSEGRTIFYNICQLSSKKGLDLLLRSYYSAFADRPHEVLLVLKTYISMSNRANERQRVKEFIDRVKQGVNMPIKNWPPVKIITSVCSEEDIQRLHAAGHAYVNSSRAEGFCIPAFEALAHGNTLISTATGGMAEYVSEGTSLMVNALMGTVYEMQGVDPFLANGVARWFEPSTAEMSDLMRVFHLLYQGSKTGKLTEENQAKWNDIVRRQIDGQALTLKNDYRITGHKLMQQLDAAYESFIRTGECTFQGKTVEV